MNLSDINTKVTELTNSDTTVGYPNANRLINLNIWNQKVFTWILDSQDSSDADDANRTGYSILSSPLQANQRDYNFGITNGITEIKTVDVSYDGVNSYKAVPIDRSELDIGLIEGETVIDTYFSKNAPAYDIKNGSVFLYPMPTATLGTVEIDVSRVAKDFTLSDLTTGTAQPGFDQNFHMAIPYGMAYEFFIANKMDTDADRMITTINDLEVRCRRQYGKKQREYPLRFEAAYEDYN